MTLPIDHDFASRYAEKTPPWGFKDLGYVVYKRTYARPIFENGEIARTEEWWETIERVINGAQAIGAGLTEDEAERLFDYMFNLKGTVGGRMLWQLGTENNKRLGADSLVNCWFTELATPEDFGWLFERLMLGGGVGFSVDQPKRLGIVRKASVVHKNADDADFIVPDKREGWSELVVKTIRAYLGDRRDKTDFTYSTALVRKAGTPIKTFGGTASGPEILVDGLNDICMIFDGAINRELTSTEVLDIANIIGRIVVSGNVRRSAQIALGHHMDEDFLTAKQWNTGNIPIWRAMSNNTVYLAPDDIPHLPEVFWEGYKGNGEAYGMFNLDASQKYGRMGEERPDYTISGTNPCVTGDTWVTTGAGPRQVNDLIDLPFDAMVDGKLYPSTGFWKTGTKPVYRLQTTDGYAMRLTGDHEVLTPAGWVEAKSLNPGDEIVIHDHFGNLGWDGDGTEDEGYVLGHLIGDGTFSTKPNGISRAYVAVWASDPGSDGPQRRLGQIILDDMPHRGDTLGWRRVAGSDQYRLSTAAVRDLAAEFGITHGNKNIGSKIESASSDFYRGFLRGLFDTDGHVEGESRKGGTSVRLSSVNYDLLVAVQRMLARLGIRSRIAHMHPARMKALPGGTYWTQESWRLIVSGEQANRFMSDIGFENADKMAKWEAAVSGMQKGFYSKSSVAAVWGITPDGTEDVYDCTVDVVHAFDANGIYVHNCGEIGLAHRESCNLSEIFLPNVESQGELIDLAKILYKVQKAVAAMPYLDKTSDEITSRNLRLGLGVTGIAQAGDKLDWLSNTYRALRQFDQEWSAERGLNESVRLTTVKPSGTLSLLAGVTPGVHPGFSRFHIRRVRMATNDPLVEFCRVRGYHVEPARNTDGSEDPRTMIVEFPCEFSKDTVFAEDTTAFEQLDLQRRMQREWADNAVSVTVYFSPEELDGVREYLGEHWAEMKSISFMLRQNHGFDQAPLEACSRETYEERVAAVNGGVQMSLMGASILLDDDECAGSCPIR